MVTKVFDKLFDPVKKISYRRMLAWGVGTALCYTGKIGDEALDEWNKYDQQRPDYEEYTKTLRYMEKVDAKILEGLDEKEAYIVDGNGNPVNLGSE